MIPKEMIEAATKEWFEVGPVASFDQRMEAALTAALSSQWRGMESAPKYISLLLANDRKDIGVGCYADHIRGDYWLWDYEGEPTHWMPLPSPPEEKTGE